MIKMTYVKRMTEDELQHHGILGMKWGKRNGPPYPLDYESHSSAEKSQNSKGRLDNYDTGTKVKRNSVPDSDVKKKTSSSNDSNSSKEKSKNENNSQSKEKTNHNYTPEETKRIKDITGLSDSQVQILKSVAKDMGIVLATTAACYAACYAAGYLLDHPGAIKNVIGKADDYAIYGFNANGSHNAYKVADIVKKQFNKVPIGSKAMSLGFRELNSSNFDSALKHGIEDGDELIRHVKHGVLSSDATRRLSCWSGSLSYYFSKNTGKDYVSRNFDNLVDFRDFGNLFKNKIDIRNLNGDLVDDFIGKFGEENGTRGTRDDAIKLVQKLYKNFGDGTNSVGFINAAYHSQTCTHQWNYEFIGKQLFMCDAWSGERYQVAELINLDGKKQIKGVTSGINKLTEELHHYNMESLRFYSPKIEDFNIDNVSKVILGRLVGDSNTGPIDLGRGAKLNIPDAPISSVPESAISLEFQNFVMDKIEKLGGLNAFLEKYMNKL